MNRVSTFCAGLLIAAGVGIPAFAHEGQHAESDGKATTITGELIDTACFTASDGGAKGKDHAACAQKCLASGIPASILPEGKGADEALVLLTNPKPFAAFAAQTIKVEGTVNQAKHLIDVKKAYVKDGDSWKEIKLDDEHHQMGGGEKKDDMKGEETGKQPAGDAHAGHQH